MAFKLDHQACGTKSGVQFLLRRLQAMWKIQHPFALIDLSNDWFIVRFSNRRDYEVGLLNGPWIISDHYLHVQRWVANFIATTTKIEALLVWVRFPILPVEYYTERWLERAGNKIGRTIKVLLASRGRFARVCVEIDLKKPVKAGYSMSKGVLELQYEGLHELCFQCGRYGHRSSICPTKIKTSEGESSVAGNQVQTTNQDPEGSNNAPAQNKGLSVWKLDDSNQEPLMTGEENRDGQR